MRYDRDTYGRPEELHASEHGALLDELGDLAETAQIELPGLTEARAKVANSGAVQAQFREKREDPERATMRVARALVDGSLDLDGAAQELSMIEATVGDSLLAKAVGYTRHVAPNRALAEFSAQLDGEAVLDAARAAAAEAREEIVKLRPVLKGIRDAEAATAAGTKAAAAWSRYQTELMPRWNAAHRFIARLRGHHLIQPLPKATKAAAQYGRFDLAQAETKAARRAGRPILPVLDETCDAWMPTGPHTAEECEAFCDEVANSDRKLDDRDAKVAKRFRTAPKQQARKKERVHAD